MRLLDMLRLFESYHVTFTAVRVSDEMVAVPATPPLAHVP